MGKKEPDPDAVFKYLGFGVHPGKLEDFWESEDEKKRYLQKVRQHGARASLLDRETSIRNVNLMTTTDKVFSIIGGVVLLIAFFLPVYSIGSGGNSVSGSAISYFINLPFIGSYASAGGVVMILAMIVFALYLLSCPVTGVLNILGLFNKNHGDHYLESVKRYSRFTYVSIFLFFLFLAILIIGAPQPFGSLGMKSMGEHLNFAAVFTMTGYGFWLNIVGLLFGFSQARGI